MPRVSSDLGLLLNESLRQRNHLLYEGFGESEPHSQFHPSIVWRRSEGIECIPTNSQKRNLSHLGRDLVVTHGPILKSMEDGVFGFNI